MRDYLGYSMSNAARMSAIFPGVGAVSVLATGWLSDRLGVNGRSLIMFVGLGATAAALLVLMTVRTSATGPLLPLIRHRHYRLLPARSLFLSRRRIRTRFRRQAGWRGLIGHHRRRRLPGRGGRGRQRRLESRWPSAGRACSWPWPPSAPWRRSAPAICTSWAQKQPREAGICLEQRVAVKRLWSHARQCSALNGPTGL